MDIQLGHKTDLYQLGTTNIIGENIIFTMFKGERFCCTTMNKTD